MIHDLARHLMAEGHIDNEPDALVAAIQILAAVEDGQMPNEAGESEDTSG